MDTNSQGTEEAAVSKQGQRARDYWRANLRIMGVLLSVWFITSFGFGILLVDWLNQIDFFGFPLGFWWAQQGSVYVFIALIFVYAAAMRRLDRRYDVDESRP
jgi:putative solute:sodium symporter small subunit